MRCKGVGYDVSEEDGRDDEVDGYITALHTFSECSRGFSQMVCGLMQAGDVW